ncbi:MAG: hypothetical protein PHS59_11955 [Paludibacter sp.]|nr:hypothetical protein [Paludibacter sp.]
MDSLGDYIYIILIAVAVLGSLLKKKKNTTGSTKPISTKRSWEDVLKELTPVENEPEEFEEIIEPAPIVIETPKIISYETIDDSSKLRSKRNVTQISSSNINHNKEDVIVVEKPELSISFSSVNDARRAFLYAEIFNRKY